MVYLEPLVHTATRYQMGDGIRAICAFLVGLGGNDGHRPFHSEIKVPAVSRAGHPVVQPERAALPNLGQLSQEGNAD